jgi:carbonic anhydrase
MKYLPQLFENNRRWAASHAKADPGFFQKLCDIQRPEYLWIGCADSRVPANEIVGLAPGELFVHRNVANLVRLGDPNCMAVVEYAVESLAVEHIIVCGHYGCGGVRAALAGGSSGIVADWIEPLVQLAAAHRSELDALADDTRRWQRLCELNVQSQVGELLRAPVVQRAWQAGRELAIHGWIYDLHDGLLRDLEVTSKKPPA